MIPYILAGLALIFALMAALYAGNAAADAAAAANWVADNNKRTKIARFEAELTGLVDDVSAIRESMHKLRSRIGMRELRERKKGAPDAAQFDKSPEGRDAERAALEKELSDKGMLNARIHLAGGTHGN